MAATMARGQWLNRKASVPMSLDRWRAQGIQPRKRLCERGRRDPAGREPEGTDTARFPAVCAAGGFAPQQSARGVALPLRTVDVPSRCGTTKCPVLVCDGGGLCAAPPQCLKSASSASSEEFPGPQRPPCFEGACTATRLRPFLRRRLSTARPHRVPMRARKPCLLMRRRLRG